MSDPPSSRVSRLRDEQIIQDVNATIELLRRHPAVRGDRIGITGFCMGGRVAYLMAAVNSLIKAAGVFYGGNILVPWGTAPTPLDRTPSIACPVIGFFGADDPNPTPADVEKIAAELTRHGKVHHFYSYPDTGHSFQWNGTPAYRAHASRDSWDKLLDWFQQYLHSWGVVLLPGFSSLGFSRASIVPMQRVLAVLRQATVLQKTMRIGISSQARRVRQYA